MKVLAKIYNLDATEKYSRGVTLDVPADSAAKAFDLPKLDDADPTYFLRLEVHDAAGKPVSENFYWLSAKPDTLDWKKRRDTAYTPQKDYGDLTALNKLPRVSLALHTSVKHQGGNGSVQVTVRNLGKGVAFMVHLRLTKGKGGEDVVPVFWDDNYVTLLPGESRRLTASYDVSTHGGAAPVVEVDGWNIATVQR